MGNFHVTASTEEASWSRVLLCPASPPRHYGHPFLSLPQLDRRPTDCAVCAEDYSPGYQHTCKSCVGESKRDAYIIIAFAGAVTLIGVAMVLAWLVSVVEPSLDAKVLLIKFRPCQCLALSSFALEANALGKKNFQPSTQSLGRIEQTKLWLVYI